MAHRYEPTLPSIRPAGKKALVVGSITPHCLPWTRSGNASGWRHPEIATFLLAMREHVAGRFDVSICEEAFDFPEVVYTDGMSKKHKVDLSVKSLASEARALNSNGMEVRCNHLLLITL